MNREIQQGTERRLTPEERQLRVKKLKRKRRFRKAVVTAAFFLILAVIISPILLFTLFRVKAFTVEGTGSYTKEQIIEASGIGMGKSLIFADLDEAAESISKNLPYADNVELSRKLPDEIIIRFEETSVSYAVQLANGMFALTNGNLKVLELSSVVPEGVAVITGEMPFSNEVGEVVAFVDPVPPKTEKKKKEKTEEPETEKDETAAVTETTTVIETTVPLNEDGTVVDTTLNLIREIISLAAKNGIENVNMINIGNRNNIYLIFEQRIVLELGTASSLDAKLALGRRVIDDENEINPSQSGVLNLTIEHKAFFKADDFDDVPELVGYFELYIPKEDESEEQPEDGGEEGTSEDSEEENDEETTGNADSESKE